MFSSGTFTLVSTENPMMSKFSDDIPTMPHENLMSQSPSNVVAIFPPKRKKMESILEQLGLGTLLERFIDEKVDPKVILSMSESSLIRLGVETLGDRIRIKDLCKKIVDEERNSSTANSATSSSQRILEERRKLFQPYNGTSKTSKRKKPPRRTWTGQFVCLADRLACRVPSSTEKQILQQAGLGLKKIRFFVDDNEEEVLEKLTSDVPGDDGLPTGFPQLKEGKGFELMSCVTNSRDLAVVKSSWSVEGLKTLFTPQTKIYLRPIQKNLRIKGNQNNRLTCKLKEKCMWCSQEIPLNELRTHLQTCKCNVLDDIVEDEVLVSLDHSSSDSEGLANGTGTANDVESLSTGQNGPSPSGLSNHSLVASGGAGNPVPGILNQAEAVPASFQGTDSISEIIPQPLEDTNCVFQGRSSDTGATGVTTEHPTTDELEVDIKEMMPKIIDHCRSTDTCNNPVEILRYMQSQLIRGRDLDVKDIGRCDGGATNYILVDRQQLLETAFDEIAALKNKFLTPEVQFYSELAEDLGGPRKEFFTLCLKAIKERYFDDGLLNYQAEAYHTVGVILGLSILQNGPMPTFLGEEKVQEIFVNTHPSECLLQLRRGLAELGIIQIGKAFPVFLHLLWPSNIAVLTLKKLTNLLKPEFGEEGSNRRRFEGEVYSNFLKYCRQVAGGYRGTIALADILRFATGAENEPILGFAIQPSIAFVEAMKGFVPTANTCVNLLQLPRPTANLPLPATEVLFNIYDFAFANSFFGNL